MGWVLVQPANDVESLAASKILTTTGECKFDLSKNGARLKPIAFGSRSCTIIEKCFHSFTGEAASGQWSIGQNRRYLWGCHFWWMCDCSAIKEILEYSGTMPMVCRWAQELLGYQFTVVHRPNHIVVNIDALTRRYGPLIAMHCMVSTILHQRDIQHNPLAYAHSTFLASKTVKLTPSTSRPDPIPIL